MRLCIECGTRHPDDWVACPQDGKATWPVEHPGEATGRRIGDRYVVLETLGLGGMSVVYRAVDVHFERPVALKVLRDNDGLDAVRFQREARLASRLSNPHTVRMLDFDETPDGQRYLAMELIEGRSLGALIAAGEAPMEPGRAARIARQILDSLAEAHEAGILHRDIKPDNVLLLAGTSEPDFVKVVDFGLARAVDGARDTGARDGQAGTPAYMSPEQCHAHRLDGRSDLYGTGVLLFELLTGQLPHDDVSPILLMVNKVSRPAPRVAEVLPTTTASPELQDLVAALLEIDPKARPATAGEALQRLTGIPWQVDRPAPSKPDRPAAPAPAAKSGARPARRTTRKAPAPAVDPMLVLLAKAVAFCDVTRQAFQNASSPRAGNFAARLLATLAAHQRSLISTYRSRYAALEGREALASLGEVLRSAPPDAGFRDTLQALARLGAERSRVVDLSSAADLGLEAFRLTSDFWAARYAEVADSRQRAFLHDVDAHSRAVLDSVRSLTERLGLDGAAARGDSTYRVAFEALRASLDAHGGAEAIQRLTPDLLTGIPGIDDQHRELLEIAGKVLGRGPDGVDDTVVHRLLPYLVSYADYHFAAEDLTMKLFRYPETAEHKDRHDRFREKFQRLEATVANRGVSASARKELNFLLAMLLHHIRTTDHLLAAFLAHARGGPADLVGDPAPGRAGLPPTPRASR